MSQSTLLVSLTAVISFVMTLFIVVRTKGPLSSSALLLIVPAPIFVSIVCQLRGIVASTNVIAATGNNPALAEWAGAIAASLSELAFAMLSTVPSYLLAIACLFIQSIQSDSSLETSNEHEQCLSAS